MNIQSNKRVETFVIPGVLFFSVVILVDVLCYCGHMTLFKENQKRSV